eukprot:5760342-Prymnesium_polylepis.2
MVTLEKPLYPSGPCGTLHGAIHRAVGGGGTERRNLRQTRARAPSHTGPGWAPARRAERQQMDHLQRV